MNIQPIILMCLLIMPLGCPKEKNPASDIEKYCAGALISEAMDELSEIRVFGVSPSGNIICFRGPEGGTFIINKISGTCELVQHALFLPKGSVDSITYEWSGFALKRGGNRLLFIGKRDEK